MAAGAALTLEKECRLPPLSKPKLQKTLSGVTTGYSNRGVAKLHPRPESSSNQPGLIFVRYGANRTMILNSFCKTLHLLNFMRRISGCRPLDNIDLVCWKTGELLQISQLAADYAYRTLKDREMYLLIKITKMTSDVGRLFQYKSLLDNLDRHNPELAMKLEELSKPGKSHCLKNKWRKGIEGGVKLERKSGLAGILAVQREKTPKQKQTRPEIASAATNSYTLETPHTVDGMSRMKLPPI
ncbi:uncharacterized protein [Watersipora subatra]|uniref:uncharacterized protein n=1 Tax=Watersipora subatra TaxID=2589382 RepID=UPI00355B41A7